MIDMIYDYDPRSGDSSNWIQYEAYQRKEVIIDGGALEFDLAVQAPVDFWRQLSHE